MSDSNSNNSRLALAGTLSLGRNTHQLGDEEYYKLPTEYRSRKAHKIGYQKSSQPTNPYSNNATRIDASRKAELDLPELIQVTTLLSQISLHLAKGGKTQSLMASSGVSQIRNAIGSKNYTSTPNYVQVLKRSNVSSSFGGSGLIGQQSRLKNKSLMSNFSQMKKSRNTGNYGQSALDELILDYSLDYGRLNSTNLTKIKSNSYGSIPTDSKIWQQSQFGQKRQDRIKERFQTNYPKEKQHGYQDQLNRKQDEFKHKVVLFDWNLLPVLPFHVQPEDSLLSELNTAGLPKSPDLWDLLLKVEENQIEHYGVTVDRFGTSRQGIKTVQSTAVNQPIRILTDYQFDKTWTEYLETNNLPYILNEHLNSKAINQLKNFDKAWFKAIKTLSDRKKRDKILLPNGKTQLGSNLTEVDRFVYLIQQLLRSHSKQSVEADKRVTPCLVVNRLKQIESILQKEAVKEKDSLAFSVVLEDSSPREKSFGAEISPREYGRDQGKTLLQNSSGLAVPAVPITSESSHATQSAIVFGIVVNYLGTVCCSPLHVQMQLARSRLQHFGFERDTGFAYIVSTKNYPLETSGGFYSVGGQIKLHWLNGESGNEQSRNNMKPEQSRLSLILNHNSFIEERPGTVNKNLRNNRQNKKGSKQSTNQDPQIDIHEESEEEEDEHQLDQSVTPYKEAAKKAIYDQENTKKPQIDLMIRAQKLEIQISYKQHTQTKYIAPKKSQGFSFGTIYYL